MCSEFTVISRDVWACYLQAFNKGLVVVVSFFFFLFLWSSGSKTTTKMKNSTFPLVGSYCVSLVDLKLDI